MFSLRLVLLLALVTGTLEDGFDLADAFDDDVPAVTPKPKELPKAPEKPKLDGGLDLSDAFGPDEPLPTKKPSKPNPGDTGDGFDLGDALGPDVPKPKPDKPVMPPKNGGGGGSFDDSDLLDVGGGGYKPDGGHAGGGGASDPNYDPHAGAGDQPQEAGSGKIAGIASAIGVALLGAASSYFAYQKKKLCFKIQGGQDPERGTGQHGTQSDPQVFSNLLRTS